MRLIDADALMEKSGWYNLLTGKCIHGVQDYEIASMPTMNDWISVKDRLPEPFVSVLTHMPEESPLPTVHEGYISRDGIWTAGMFRREPGEVTHWMPMPEPPKEDSRD